MKIKGDMPMDIVVTFKHLEPTEAIKKYAETKISKLEKYLNDIIEAHVTLSMERVQHKESGAASIKLVAKNITINAQEESSDIYAAIDLLTDKVETQIRKHKEKSREKFKDSEQTEIFMQEMSAPDIEIIDNYEIKQMDLHEAVNRLNKKNENFIIFKNKESFKNSVLYAKDNGEYAVIEINS
ncbi:MAG: ribosome-associated translation inhibitor RaiA [Candidatus Acididesulfobacter guangdongensis]|uniref:Ribosome-associated translation inhibitor RaiA n=1 Tax=Acididesulfobacter guangdongensis TaxID=2597225 RepID=A0A519BGG3_ACIG2|nr:MAG: ribosome-associated translation inhibitor RaiA [Candidatus Acididesulfobacter guangdongensis]